MTYVRQYGDRLFHVAAERVRDGRVKVPCKPDHVSADEMRYTKPGDDILCSRCVRAHKEDA